MCVRERERDRARERERDNLGSRARGGRRARLLNPSPYAPTPTVQSLECVPISCESRLTTLGLALEVVEERGRGLPDRCLRHTLFESRLTTFESRLITCLNRGSQPAGSLPPPRSVQGFRSDGYGQPCLSQLLDYYPENTPKVSNFVTSLPGYCARGGGRARLRPAGSLPPPRSVQVRLSGFGFAY